MYHISCKQIVNLSSTEVKGHYPITKHNQGPSNFLFGLVVVKFLKTLFKNIFTKQQILQVQSVGIWRQQLEVIEHLYRSTGLIFL